jgi:hypothetical protein
MYADMMPLWGVDIILGDFELSLSFCIRTNKMIPQPINVLRCSTPIIIRMLVIMEEPELTMINL